MCHQRSPHPRGAQALRSSADRIGDADRDGTVSLLADAAGEGYLGTAELDDRLQAALTARTHADLAALHADLPPAWLAARERSAAADRARRAARASLPRHLISYAGIMALLVAIWLVGALTTGSWYPWPVWPALGMGIGLVGHVRATA